MEQLQTAPAQAGASAHGEHPAGGDHVPHVVALKAYLGVFGALLGLTALTVAVSYFDFGEWNAVVALLVASTKALLVAGVFMHLAFDKKKFNAVVLIVSVLFLAVLIAFTSVDTQSRGIADSIEQLRPRDYTAPFANGKPDVEPAGAQPTVGGPSPSTAPGPVGR